MALPLVLGIGAAIAGATGIGAGVNGAIKMKGANDINHEIERQHKDNIERLEQENKITSEAMDDLGKLELEILHSFQTFSDSFEKIKNKPIFENYYKNGIILPRYDGEKIKEVSIGAGVLLGGLGGAGLGTAGGFAAAGATTAAVMALGTASTGTAIASLSGAALTNATLAALGGGAISVGGGGIALGTTILGVTTLGAGLLVGGFIFNFAGMKVFDKAEKTKEQVQKEEEKINTICNYLVDLCTTSKKYYEALSSVKSVYQKYLDEFNYIVTTLEHTDWKKFTKKEKMITESTVLLVGLLYNMCKVELVLKAEREEDINSINKIEIEKSVYNAELILKDKFQYSL